MKYVSEKKLLEIHKDESHSIDFRYACNALAAQCKELTPQWQTIEEFIDNPVNGNCFVTFVSKKRKIAFFDTNAKRFYDHEKSGWFYSTLIITHVMPIKTPEAPK